MDGVYALRALCGKVFDASVAEIQAKIGKYDAEIQPVEDQDVVDLPADELSRDARNVSDQNGDQENETLSLGRARGVAFVDRERPRKTETDEHDEFKNRLHSRISFFLSSATIIHLTKRKVKYIIITELISFRYESEKVWNCGSYAIFIRSHSSVT